MQKTNYLHDTARESLSPTDRVVVSIVFITVFLTACLLSATAFYQATYKLPAEAEIETIDGTLGTRGHWSRNRHSESYYLLSEPSKEYSCAVRGAYGATCLQEGGGTLSQYAGHRVKIGWVSLAPEFLLGHSRKIVTLEVDGQVVISYAKSSKEGYVDKTGSLLFIWGGILIFGLVWLLLPKTRKSR